MSEKIQRKLDAAEALNNMLLLCGEPELDDLTDPASRLRALIDGLITQRNRADAAEAKIARLKEENFALAANQCHAGYSDEFGNHRCRYQDAAQPPAVGEDVVETIACASYEEAVAAKRAILREKYPDWASLPEKHREAGRALGRFIAKRLASASLLRTKDAG